MAFTHTYARESDQAVITVAFSNWDEIQHPPRGLFVLALQQIVDSFIVGLLTEEAFEWLAERQSSRIRLRPNAPTPQMVGTEHTQVCYWLSPCGDKGLANSRFHTLLFGINSFRSDELPHCWAKSHCSGQLCNYCATKNATVFQTVC